MSRTLERDCSLIKAIGPEFDRLVHLRQGVGCKVALMDSENVLLRVTPLHADDGCLMHTVARIGITRSKTSEQL